MVSNLYFFIFDPVRSLNITLTNTLLEQILDEMKKFNEERDSIKVKLNEVQESNALLLETVAQQQRFLEEIDNEKRAKNLIVLGVPEKDWNVNGTIAKTNEEKIALVLRSLQYDEGNVESVRRLGKLVEGAARARPIKVVLPSFEERQTVLVQQATLETVHGGALKNIKLKRDVHPAIRKEYGRLYEAERSEKAKAENQGKEVLFDTKKRVLLIDGEIVDRFKPSFF